MRLLHMPHTGELAWLFAVMVLGSCGSKAFRPPDQDLGRVEALRNDERLLFEPSGDPEGLLGRPVRVAADGSWEIGDARMPGCLVTPRRERMSGHTHYVEASSRVASLGFGRGGAVGLQAKYGKSAQVELEIDHTELLRADLTGTCGEKVVTRVKVGIGHRHFLRERGGAVSAGVLVSGATVGGKHAGMERVGASQDWAEPQAWAFAVGEGTTSADDLKVIMPTRVRAGQPFAPTIEVRRDMWLIVLYQDMNGDHGVVTPDADPQRSATWVRGGSQVVLPDFVSEAPVGRESEAVHEQLLVYGFPEEGDFNACRPPAGILTAAEANAYASELRDRRLQELPRSRWASTSFRYVIEPAK